MVNQFMLTITSLFSRLINMVSDKQSETPS